MASTSQSSMSKGTSSTLNEPDDDPAILPSENDSGIPSENIANPKISKLISSERSIQRSSASSTPVIPENGEEDKIEPVLSNNPHEPPISPIRRRRTNRTIASDNYEAWEKSYVFSFDGGGVRGLSTLFILKRLMLRIKELERSSNPPAMSSYHPTTCPYNISNDDLSTAGYYPCHYIDYMAGTSTGGLIAIMLSRLRMDVDDTIDEFKRLATIVFGKRRKFSIRGPILWMRPKYDYHNLDMAVKQVLDSRLPKLRHNIGGQQFPSNPDMCRTMVIAHGKRDEGHEDTYIFRSYDHPTTFKLDDSSIRNPGPANTSEIQLIARATSAAPTYFDPVQVGNRKLGDGGFGCSNPSWEAYNEVQDMHNSDDAAITLVSIGTGESFVRRFSSAGGFTELIQILRAAKGLATDTHKVDELLRKITQKRPDAYFRFNADNRLGKIKLDCWKKARGKHVSTADDIQQITESYLDKPEVTEEINRVADILVQNRRLRATTERWEDRLFGLKWRCLFENCPEPTARVRIEFEDHLQNYHDFGPVAEQTPETKEEYEDLIARGKFEAN